MMEEKKNDSGNQDSLPEIPEEASQENTGEKLKSFSTMDGPQKVEKLFDLIRSPRYIMVVSLITVFAMSFSIFTTVSSANKRESLQENYEAQLSALSESNADLNSQIKTLKAENEELSAKVDEYENGASAQLVKIKNAYEKEEWQTVISLYKVLHEKYNGSQEDTQAKEMSEKAQKAIDDAAAKKKQEEQEAEKKKQEEEAKGYETGITYAQLARTPDEYVGKKVKFTGKVVQVTRGDTSTDIRLAVDSDYDQIILAEFSNDLTSSRVLEDDVITIYGMSMGDYTYTSVMGASITVPLVLISKMDQ
jgi:cell division protein FtsB